MSGFWNKLKQAFGSGQEDAPARSDTREPVKPEENQVAELPHASPHAPLVIVVGAHSDLEDPTEAIKGLADALERGVKAMGLDAEITIKRLFTPIFEPGVTQDWGDHEAYYDNLIEVLKREDAPIVVCANAFDEEDRLVFTLTPTFTLADFLAPMTTNEFHLDLALEAQDGSILTACVVGASLPVMLGHQPINLDICKPVLAVLDQAIAAEGTDKEVWSPSYLALKWAGLATQYAKWVGDLQLLERADARYRDILRNAGPDTDGFSLGVQIEQAEALQVLGHYRNDPNVWREALTITRRAYEAGVEELSAYQRRDLESLHLELLISLGQREGDEPTLREAVDVARQALAAIHVNDEPRAWANAIAWLSRALIILFEQTYARAHLDEAQESIDAGLAAIAELEATDGLRLSLLRQLAIVHKARTSLTQDGQDMQAAITAFEAMLELLSDDDTDQTAAQIHLEIGELKLGQYPLEHHGETLDEAIDHLSLASLHLDRNAGELSWAEAQFNTGNAYALRSRTRSSGPDIDRALTHYERAGQVFTAASHREFWVDLQACKASALMERARLGDNGADDLRSASHVLGEALKATEGAKAPRLRADMAHDLAGVEIWRAGLDQDLERVTNALATLDIALGHRTANRDFQAWVESQQLRLDGVVLQAELTLDPALFEAALSDIKTFIQALEDHSATSGARDRSDSSLEGAYAMAGNVARRLDAEFGQTDYREEALSLTGTARDLAAKAGRTAQAKALNDIINALAR